MVRRTKEDAEQTRRLILQAARETFREHGVSNTSLEFIAQAAGLTRGAIYWHFANKQELFKAMCDEVTLPLADRMDYTLLLDPQAQPLTRVRNFLEQVVDLVGQDTDLRNTMTILNFKCEFVGDMAQDLGTYISCSEECQGKLRLAYQAAKRAGQLHAGLNTGHAAWDTLMFMTGLLRLYLLGLPDLQVRRKVSELITAHVALRGASAQQAQDTQPPPAAWASS